jgi:hypothetical protein
VRGVFLEVAAARGSLGLYSLGEEAALRAVKSLPKLDAPHIAVVTLIVCNLCIHFACQEDAAEWILDLGSVD